MVIKMMKSDLYISDHTRKKVFIALTSIFILLLFGYGIYNMVICNFIIGTTELTLSTTLTILLVLFIKRKAVLIPILFFMTSLYSMSLYLFKSGGAHGTGLFWLFVVPVVFFFFLGARRGLALSLFQLFSVTAVYFFSMAGYTTIPYNGRTIFFFLIVSLFQTAILYVHEIILQNYFTQIKALRGLLPICSVCKKIRDDTGYWNSVETYIADHSEADFTHSICPVCARELYPELFDEEGKKKT